MRTVTWLLAWAIAVVAVDAVVIVRHDEHHASAARSRDAGSSSATARLPGASDGATTVEPTSASEGATSDTTSDSAPGVGPTASTTTTPSPPETTPTGDVVVAHLQGDGETLNSAGFHVDGHWQLRWRVDPGGGVAATVDNDDLPADDPHHSVLFAGLTPGEGSTDVGTTCNCTLHLTPDGSGYDVLVVDVLG